MDKSLLSSPELRPSEFEMIRDLAMKTFGLELRAGKERLVAARLTKHLRAGGFRTFRQYYDRVRSDSSGELLIGLIDSLTTNHTGFLREPSHFDFLTDLLRTEYRNRHRMDIWCAASATGEEPYTLLFTALSCIERPVLPDVRILASDISTRAPDAEISRPRTSADRLLVEAPSFHVISNVELVTNRRSRRSFFS